MPQWEHTAFAKIHEGCGGLVRWVEAIDQRGVGYTGECRGCHDQRISIEDIIPIRSDPQQTGQQLVDDVDRETLAELVWDDDAEWNDNQLRLRDEIGKP